MSRLKILRRLAGRVLLSLAGALPLAAAGAAGAAENPAVVLPPGIRAVWDLEKAFREATTTRERVCLNGLWRWQPAEAAAARPPEANWGYFKVPGCWPGITDYMQKDCQTVHAHPVWKDTRLGSVTAAWQERMITVPSSWGGRRITLRAEYLNSLATVYVDGQRAGELHYPGGELDVTPHCRPGASHRLSLLVVALPLRGVMLSYVDTAAAREVRGSVARRGLCGDVSLVSAPTGPRIVDTRIETSVRQGRLTLDVGVEGLPGASTAALRARILRGATVVKEFSGGLFRGTDLKNGRITLTEAWKPQALWDTHTPTNTHLLEMSLVDGTGRVLDAAWPERFGFREFWAEGRDFYLNGSRVFLSCVPLDNAQVSAGLATYEGARESLERLRSFGINFVYTHNYGCEPGSHLGFEEILRAADDVGMLVSFSQPHFSHYDWTGAEADRTNGYARHAAFYVRAAQNHPSVVAYSMSHNATGYNDDMNPDLIDGLRDVRDVWALRNVARALRAEAIVHRLDPGRLIYHHASGNLGSMHVINFYPNFVPIQELSDWFGHWAQAGIKPVFLCEYGAPFTWDWTMYRGWYEGQRAFGSAVVPWEFCLAEWNAQFVGDQAYRISEAERTNLRWEARQFQAGKLWHRWDYPHQVGSTIFAERYPVFARYITDNWRAFRTWGVSGTSPWEHGHYWVLREGVDKRRRELPTDWDRLQRPGFSPDYIEARYERMDLAFEREDWIATPAAQALLRNNRPLLAYIAGKAERFTSKDHLFRPGETVEKQLILINNSREAVTCEAQWAAGLPQVVRGSASRRLGPGAQERVPLRFALEPAVAAGTYELKATVRFSTGEVQEDTLTLAVLPPVSKARAAGKTGLFDPKGQTRALLDRLGVAWQPVDTSTDVAGFDLVIVGKDALSPGGAAPDLRRVRDGLKVIVFEQSAETLEKRLGFRVQEYGLRQVFARVPDHPVLQGLSAGHLRDWRGEATLLSPRARRESSSRFNGAPTTTWCGLTVTRLWRCGNQGNVASVLIEKPARGDFLPVADGGYSLQYSPLLEYREGRGMVLFCQMDVTGRTENDPAAETLARNLLEYAVGWKPAPRRSVVYAGAPEGRHHLEAAGVAVTPYTGQALSREHLLVAGRGCGRVLGPQAEMVAAWLRAGGRLLAIGLGQDDTREFLPFEVRFTTGEHVAAYFEPAPAGSWLAGVAPADVHNRDPRPLPLVSGGALGVGNGVLARAANLDVYFCQLEPWGFSAVKPMNQKRTFRRTAFLVERLLGNLGVACSTPLLERLGSPVTVLGAEKRWLSGFYLDQPEEWDDPYRFFRW